MFRNLKSSFDKNNFEKRKTYEKRMLFSDKGNNKITELRTILQRESQNS